MYIIETPNEIRLLSREMQASNLQTIWIEHTHTHTRKYTGEILQLHTENLKSNSKWCIVFL